MPGGPTRAARQLLRLGCMDSVVGIFGSRQAAEHALARLVDAGFTSDRLNLLTPDASDAELASVPTSEQEQVFSRIMQVLPETVEIAADITVHLARRCYVQ